MKKFLVMAILALTVVFGAGCGCFNNAKCEKCGKKGRIDIDIISLEEDGKLLCMDCWHAEYYPDSAESVEG